MSGTSFRLSPKARAILTFLSSRQGQSLTSTLESSLSLAYEHNTRLADLYLSIPKNDKEAVEFLSFIGTGGDTSAIEDFKLLRSEGLAIDPAYISALRKADLINRGLSAPKGE